MRRQRNADATRKRRVNARRYVSRRKAMSYHRGFSERTDGYFAFRVNSIVAKKKRKKEKRRRGPRKGGSRRIIRVSIERNMARCKTTRSRNGIEFFRKFDISRFRLYDDYDKQMDPIVRRMTHAILINFPRIVARSKHQDYFWPNVFLLKFRRSMRPWRSWITVRVQKLYIRPTFTVAS